MNFDFIKPHQELNQLYNICSAAEKMIGIDFNACVGQCRLGGEYIVKFLYSTYCGDYTGLTVFDMMTDPSFISNLNDDAYLNSLHFIRKKGNVALHQGNLVENDALDVLEHLQFVAGELLINLGLVEDYPEFVNPLIKPTTVEKDNNEKETVIEEVKIDEEVVAKFYKTMRNTKFSVKHAEKAEENKKMFLLASLTDTKWPVVRKKNTALPCSAGINMIIDTDDTCDYILYGKDNKPLAIIELIKDNIILARINACKKADKLEKKYGYKPVVYYTNGYYIYCIDQLGYGPRRVFNFHTIDELEWILFKKNNRKAIVAPVVNEQITDRQYQKDAITAVCNAFASFRRKSLIVLATGTGKTRVSISLVEILMKAGWVKNVLFLADRTSLVKQAHKNYNKLLPNVTTSIYTGGEHERDSNAKIIFSTYQTMMNLIDKDTKEFSSGRFDLIIVDEAHRSIFKKFSAIFDYFDSLMLGLTATPRSDINKNTFEFFDLPNDKPDYAYELVEAIKDKYLVGFAFVDKTTQDLKRGIRYDELSDEEQKKVEEVFEHTSIDFLNKNIDLSHRFINEKTIDLMLNDLMTHGLKIDGGDKIGKTIIFAKSHEEAEVIVKRFNKMYKNTYPSDFCRLIDSKVEESQSLIEKFEVRDGNPYIAVSVDMMDTGVDVPDVLNLIFFKKIESKIKFLQMIGRGTRLSPNIFGPGKDKSGFIVFDYYDNFNYFSQGNTWTTMNNEVKTAYINNSISSKINNFKLEILHDLQKWDDKGVFDISYMEELKKYFIDSVQSLVNDNISVQMKMAYVNKYRNPEEWEFLDERKIMEIKAEILKLVPSNEYNQKIKYFDFLIYKIERSKAILLKQNQDVNFNGGLMTIIDHINLRLNELCKLKSIPEIVEKSDFIDSMFDCKYILKDFSFEKAEYARKQLRDLMIYLPDHKEFVVVEHDDYYLDDKSPIVNVKNYAEKVQEYLFDTQNPILAKIMNLDELEKEEQEELKNQLTNVLGTESDFKGISNGLALLTYIRKEIGFTDYAIKNKFGSFLNNNVLNPSQLLFCNQIIDYCRNNGDFTAGIIQKVSPFCDIDVISLFGVNFTYVKQLITGLHKPVEWKK